MAGRPARLTNRRRITDDISLGVIAKSFPIEKINAILMATGKQSQRRRDLPAKVMVYYVIALAVYMEVGCREVLRCLLEGIQWLLGPGNECRVAGKSGISQARRRLGWEPLQQLHEEVVRPIAKKETKGAWYRQWQMVSLDGSTVDVADSVANANAWGRPGASRGTSAYPQLRFVSLVENGTHVLFGTQMGPYRTGEARLAEQVVEALRAGMLCLADRQFFSFPLWKKAQARGAELLWRVKKNMRLPCHKRLPDGSYQSRIYRCERDRRQDRNALPVRVIEYRLHRVGGAEPIYRLITTLLDHESAPAQELAALYHERWEIETALSELKTHLRGRQMVLRSKTPDLVRQEFYGLLLAHFAIRGLMHEAALQAEEDPDRLSFVHAVRVVRRKLPLFVAIPPRGEGDLSSGGVAGDLAGAGGLEPEPTLSPRREAKDEQLSLAASAL